MLRLSHYIAAASVLLSRITSVLGDPIEFLYPVDEGGYFHYLDRVDVSYLSNYSEPYLYVWCEPLDVTLAQSDRPDGFNATAEVTLQFSTTGSLECWFNLREDSADDNSDDKGLNSVHWTFYPNERANGVSTLGLTTTTATGTSSVSVSTPTASTSTTVLATASATPASSGVSTGAKAGIGVGVAIGVIAAAAAAGAFLFRRRKRRNQASTEPGDMGGRGSPPPFQSMAELPEQQGAAEMGVLSPSAAVLKGKYAPVDSQSPVQELPAEYPGPEVERFELPATVDREDREDREDRGRTE